MQAYAAAGAAKTKSTLHHKKPAMYADHNPPTIQQR
jgi:hypothetical protein